MTQTTTLGRVVAIVAAVALAFSILAVAGDASANGRHRGGDNDVETRVKNSNAAIVVNVVNTDASTGGNDADGGNGGNSGDVENDDGDEQDIEDADTGNGGNGGKGGSVTTGTAVATSVVTNDVNYNDTSVRANCDCGRRGGDVETKVRNRNFAYVKNIVNTGANSGDNDANGGNGGNSGDVENDDGDEDQEIDDATTGNGGAGGQGGTVRTGRADSLSTVQNYVNTNVTRVVRR